MSRAQGTIILRVRFLKTHPDDELTQKSHISSPDTIRFQIEFNHNSHAESNPDSRIPPDRVHHEIESNPPPDRIGSRIEFPHRIGCMKTMSTWSWTSNQGDPKGRILGVKPVFKVTTIAHHVHASSQHSWLYSMYNYAASAHIHSSSHSAHSYVPNECVGVFEVRSTWCAPTR